MTSNQPNSASSIPPHAAVIVMMTSVANYKGANSLNYLSVEAVAIGRSESDSMADLIEAACPELSSKRPRGSSLRDLFDRECDSYGALVATQAAWVMEAFDRHRAQGSSNTEPLIVDWEDARAEGKPPIHGLTLTLPLIGKGADANPENALSTVLNALDALSASQQSLSLDPTRALTRANLNLSVLKGCLSAMTKRARA